VITVGGKDDLAIVASLLGFMEEQGETGDEAGMDREFRFL
jgi:hypothetical protein